MRTSALLGSCLCTALLSQAAVRLKDVASIEGVRGNQLIGYGIVVGLNGTGDRRQTVFSAQSLASVLNQLGVTVPPAAIRVQNTASVLVTATLPPFARPGARIDVTASAIGDASNLQGGVLILTTLRGVDGQTYAVAQGPVLTGGFVASGGANNRSSVNHPTVGRVPEGAIVERAPPSVDLASGLRLQLARADFTNAARIADAVNKRFSAQGTPPVAVAENAASVAVRMPEAWTGRPAQFISDLELLTVETDRGARIVINERTGTIVMGRDVRIAPVAVLHGSLTVEISTSFDVSQPAPFSQGSTQVVPQVDVGVKEEKARNIMLGQGATVDDLVRALGAIGATPRDIIAILQNLKAAGALDAEMEVI